MVIQALSIRESLETLGLQSTVSEKSTTGIYAPSDADWNYKDIPHLAEVHHQVDGVLIEAGDQHLSSIFLQRIGPVSIPMVVFIGATSHPGITYFGAAGPFVLMISTTWMSEQVGSTQVTTRYEVFSKKLFRPFHPLIHRLLSRNYEVLMAADLPMREQRGFLRSRGYRFRGDTDGYQFRDSVNIHIRNLVAPESLRSVEISIDISGVPQGLSRHGGDAEDGIILNRQGEQVSLFPLICDHEGANLGCAPVSNRGLKCPWHGRNVRPLANVDLFSKTSEVFDEKSRVFFVDSRLVVQRDFP